VILSYSARDHGELKEEALDAIREVRKAFEAGEGDLA
jgi:hypothetical protein